MKASLCVYSHNRRRFRAKHSSFFHPFLFFITQRSDHNISGTAASEQAGRRIRRARTRILMFFLSGDWLAGWWWGAICIHMPLLLGSSAWPSGHNSHMKIPFLKLSLSCANLSPPTVQWKKKRQKESEVGRCSRRGNVSLFYSSRWGFKGLNARLGRFQLLILQVGHGGLIALCFKGGWVPFVISLFNHHIMF